MDVEAPEVMIEEGEALHVSLGEEPSRFSVAELARHFAKITKEWARESKYFASVTALAGIGEVEKVEIEPGLPEEEQQKVYDAIQAGWEKAAEDFFQLDKALKMFYLDFGRFPTMEEGGLRALVESTQTPQWNGPYTEEQHLVDKYGTPYTYRLRKDITGNIFVELITPGYDNVPGTKDDRKRMILERDARRWGDWKSYR
jgi:general secretion pathway protein G